MEKIVVTVGGAVAWLIPVFLAYRWRSTTRPEVAPADAPFGVRLHDLASRAAGGVAGAVVAGVLVLGGGGRLLMRILAATSPDAQGRLTDAQEIVGRVSYGGTIGLLTFVGILGGLVSFVLFTVLRRFLPERSVTAGLVAGGIGAGLTSRMTGLIDPDNHDFTLLTPRWLALALAVGLLVTFSISGAVLMDRWAGRFRVGRSPRGVLTALCLLPLGLTGPIGGAVVLLAVLRLSIAPQVATAAASIQRVGGAVVGLGAVVGAVWTAVGVYQVAVL